MKRWNRKGSTHAKERMGELRVLKLQKQRSALADQYRQRFGGEWFPMAKASLTPASQPMDPAARTQEHIDWLRTALTA